MFLENILNSEKVAFFSKHWAACFVVALFLPTFGPDRIWILVAPPLFLLVINAYLQLVLFFQTKKDIIEENSMGVPKFFVNAINPFLCFCILPLVALIFIPGAMAEMGAYLVQPFTTESLITSLLILLVYSAFTVLGALLSVARGRQMWKHASTIDHSDKADQ